MDNTLKLQIALADAMNCAHQAYNNNGWRKAPAQSKICCDLIKGENHQNIIAILDTWNKAFHATINKLADESLKEMVVI